MPKLIQDEVDLNYEAFQKLLPTIVTSHHGKYALMKDQEIKGYYSSAADARGAGNLAFPDKMFSIQHVTDESIQLRFYNYAVLNNNVQPASRTNNSSDSVSA